MTREHQGETSRGLRLWPGVAIVAAQWTARYLLPALFPSTTAFGLLAGLAGGMGVMVWWAFWSRAPQLDRWGGVMLMLAALAATPLILHESVATATLGLVFPLYAVPVLSLAFVLWAAWSRRLADGPRRVAMAATIFIACGSWALVRTHGIASGFDWDFSWRWAETAEERLLATEETPLTVTAAPQRARESDSGRWPGFRGPSRDGRVSGVRIVTDWASAPPVELWRRPVGPGWSSVALSNDLLYTQEQRGDEEVVACYRARSGEPVWRHGTPTRFWEAMAGAGPRATPAVDGGRVFALGATGALLALDAQSGALLWSRQAAEDAGVEVPLYGFAGSPLVHGDSVIVSLESRLVAYDGSTGERQWMTAADAGEAGSTFYESYSSPHLWQHEGEHQILLMDATGLTSVSPADGERLWQHPWPGLHNLQPAVIDSGEILVANSNGSRGVGVRRLTVTRAAGDWTAEESWTSDGLKPYFSDFVVHEGHAYGFDGRILASIDLRDGARNWKGGRFGAGQLVLLSDQGLLLVLSEKGELALVEASPEAFVEVARVPVLHGKTWNHPVLVGNLLVVRNAEEMAAFRLALEEDS